MSRRVFACVLLASLFACSGRSVEPLPSQGSSEAAAQAAGVVAATDMGRRRAGSPVFAVVMLRYNHEADLRRFVDELARSRSPQYLTHAQFTARYAPTFQQEARVEHVLRRNGFTIDRTYANRTTLDVSAPSAAVERLFSTRIDDFQQGRYGVRYANVTPVRVPPALQPLVLGVDTDSRILRYPDIRVRPVPNGALAALHSETATNVIRNPGFEKGRLKPWTSCRSSNKLPAAVITTVHPHSGMYDAYAGTFKGYPEPNGITTVCQKVTIPTAGTLQLYTWGVSNDEARNVFEFGALYKASNDNLVTTLYEKHNNDKRWHRRSFDLSAYAGQTDYVAFGVQGRSSHRGKVVGQYLDDVSLTAGTATPGPTATPSAPPTTGAACPSPSAAAPTPTPNYGPGTGSSVGWGPASVNDGFDMPCNYGYGGSGQTIAIVIDEPANPSDVAAFLSNYGIKQTGAIATESVEGTAAINDTQGEATLDEETIAGLAPDANIIVYFTSSLSDGPIIDAYSKITSEGKATVINSSFGGCESDDASFDTMSDNQAMGAVAQGVTFSASAGDDGANCPIGGKYSIFGVSAPASGPHFVAVGGTQTTSGTNLGFCPAPSPQTPITNPTVWNDCVGAGGGGVSSAWAEPSYQSSISGASTSGRNVPDIALPAAYDEVYFTGGSAPWVSGWNFVWGTSWSSPIYVAMQAGINQACANHEWGINTVYNAFSKSKYAHFIDVTSGNNAYSAYGYTRGYTAAAGFDNVSGIGIPLGIELAIDECNLTPAIRRPTRPARPTPPSWAESEIRAGS